VLHSVLCKAHSTLVRPDDLAVLSTYFTPNSSKLKIKILRQLFLLVGLLIGVQQQ
jgi:hypothetical protein